MSDFNFSNKYEIYDSRISNFINFLLILILGSVFFYIFLIKQPDLNQNISTFHKYIPAIILFVFFAIVVIRNFLHVLNPEKIIIFDHEGLSYKPVMIKWQFKQGQYRNVNVRSKDFVFIKWNNIK